MKRIDNVNDVIEVKSVVGEYEHIFNMAPCPCGGSFLPVRQQALKVTEEEIVDRINLVCVDCRRRRYLRFRIDPRNPEYKMMSSLPDVQAIARALLSDRLRGRLSGSEAMALALKNKS